ncbi:hypothetical protein Tco_0903260, partial [Tanacetum coccineum]
MSLSDSKEQNKKDIDGEDGYNQFQKSSPAWCAADYFERLSPEERMAEVRPYQEWVISHTCTTCGVLDYWCRCKRWARLQNMELPQCVVPIYGSSTKCELAGLVYEWFDSTVFGSLDDSSLCAYRKDASLECHLIKFVHTTCALFMSAFSYLGAPLPFFACLVYLVPCGGLPYALAPLLLAFSFFLGPI